MMHASNLMHQQMHATTCIPASHAHLGLLTSPHKLPLLRLLQNNLMLTVCNVQRMKAGPQRDKVVYDAKVKGISEIRQAEVDQ